MGSAVMSDDKTPSDTHRSGLVQGGRGGPEDELLDDGQEEVFSRTEVESGRIEHHVEAGSDAASAKRPSAP